MRSWERGCWDSGAFMSGVDGSAAATTEADRGAALVDALDGHHSQNDH